MDKAISYVIHFTRICAPSFPYFRHSLRFGQILSFVFMHLAFSKQSLWFILHAYGIVSVHWFTISVPYINALCAVVYYKIVVKFGKMFSNGFAETEQERAALARSQNLIEITFEFIVHANNGSLPVSVCLCRAHCIHAYICVHGLCVCLTKLSAFQKPKSIGFYYRWLLLLLALPVVWYALLLHSYTHHGMKQIDCSSIRDAKFNVCSLGFGPGPSTKHTERMHMLTNIHCTCIESSRWILN